MGGGMARKTWVLDTGTKGTGANVVPLERAKESSEKAQPHRPRPAAPSKRRAGPVAAPPPEARRTSTPLPAGHVRKRATGELGKVRSVDARTGTVTVLWLRSGAVSTLPLSAVTRR
jgi:hypothetical protein